MITIKVYGLDQFVVGRFSREITAQLAKLYEVLAQVEFEIFILEIKPCNLLPFPSHRGIWKQASTRTDKIHRSHRKSLLGPRKIVLITTCIECKKVE